MLGAVMYGHEQMQVAIGAIKELAAEAGKPKWDWEPRAGRADLVDALRERRGRHRRGLQRCSTSWPGRPAQPLKAANAVFAGPASPQWLQPERSVAVLRQVEKRHMRRMRSLGQETHRRP
jgi:polyribonucleotide nucleotidyltransferase